MKPTTRTCKGISYKPFAQGDALLVVASPALVLQTVGSLAIQDETTSEIIVQIVIPLLDAVHANAPLGVFQGTARERARMADLKAVPWAWEGEVTVEPANQPVIDSERFISGITAAYAHQTGSAATAAFVRDHPWLPQTIVEAEAREDFAKRLSDDRLEQLFGKTTDTFFETILREAKPKLRRAFSQAVHSQNPDRGKRLFVQMMRAHLTRPRFPPLALVLPDTRASRTYLERLLHKTLTGFTLDGIQAMERH